MTLLRPISGFYFQVRQPPRVMITLYGPDALHVDFKFVKVDDVTTRVDEPVILWARDSRLAKGLGKGKGQYPPVDPQWIEDRFWVWVHYAGTKIGRGEYFEALEFLSFLRVQVLGSLALQQAGLEARGVRKIEQLLPDFAKELRMTVAVPERESLLNATEHAITIYQNLRNDITECCKAQALAMNYLHKLRNTNTE